MSDKLQANLKAFLKYNYTEEPLSREKLLQIIEWFAGTTGSTMMKPVLVS